MTHTPFRPKTWEWSILTHQLASLAQLAAGLDRFASDLNAMRAGLRVLEAAARRLVLVLALMRPALKPVAPRRMTRMDVQRMAEGAGSVGRALFQLVEPMPGYGAAQKRFDPPDKGPRITRLPLASLGLAMHASQRDAEAVSELSPSVHGWARVQRRVEALQDVVARPQAHADRLRRWYARQQGRRMAGRLARPSPLLPGRPSALQRGDHLHPTRRSHDPCQQVLFEAQQLALSAQRPP